MCRLVWRPVPSQPSSYDRRPPTLRKSPAGCPSWICRPIAYRALMRQQDPVREVSLWGEDHVEFGEIAVSSLDEAVAIAISKGRHPKGYPTLDSNEDAVLAAASERSTVLAVVDGHRGFDAARAALRAVAASVGDLLSAATDPRSRIEAAHHRAIAAVRDAIGAASPERSMSKTTLGVVLVEGGTVSVGGFGDSDVKLVEPRRSRSLWRPAPFLGPDARPEDAWFATTPLRSSAWVVAGTDGVFDFLGRDWAEKLEFFTAGTADEFARSTIETAFDGGAGDHSALAVIRP